MTKTYKFGQLRSETLDDWEDEIATIPERPSRKIERSLEWKTVTPMAYATTDVPMYEMGLA